MIRCNSFCLARDGEAAGRAARQINRFYKKVSVIEGRGKGEGWTAVGLALDGEGFPLVHGLPGLECSVLQDGPTGMLASRDALGTRPLFVAKSGSWVASDHRYFRGDEAELLPPGASLEVGSGEVSAKRLESRKFEGTLDEAADELTNLVQEAVKARVKGKRRVAVAFSGGLDSSLVAQCAAAQTKVIACSVSAPGSVDEKVARDAAEKLGLEYAHAELDPSGARDDLRKMDLPFAPSEMDKGLWCIYSRAARVASERDAETIMLGQLADELFGGYAKYERRLREGGAGEAAEMMSNDVRECGMRGFVRDELACSRWIEPSFPFADVKVAEFGLSLPVGMKIAGGERKVVLRRAAQTLGLPEEFAMRRKKAAQYSSGVLKVIR